ncbi:MAG: zinc-binding alcohol dehydrogenase [Actinobacteria bacterium]|nr:MAG: zinc-binding alcohol dehydrogenase [Actinomycetota bacterium]
MKGRVLRFVAPRRVGYAVVDVLPPADGELLVRTRWSGISGGTELLAYRGELDPDSARDETISSLGGRFEYPFAYGYSCVGEVVTSHDDDVPEGAAAFAFHPHQDLFTVRGTDAVIIDQVDGRIATLFPLVETALQVSLDAGPRLEEPVVILGLGPVGILTAALLDRAGAEVVGVDPREDRREAAILFGIPAVNVSEIGAVVERLTSGAGVPLVVDATGHPPALARALELLRHEGEVLVCSWYGTKDVSLPLGREFHRRRLQIRSTQVSTIPTHLAGKWDVQRRRRVATRLLTELPLKLLTTHDVAFDRAAEAYAALDRGDAGLMHVALRY